MKSDRAWFAQNPDRTYRLRRALPGEPGEFIMVRQLMPGMRMRRDVTLTGDPDQIDRVTDFDLHVCWTQGELPLVRGYA